MDRKEEMLEIISNAKSEVIADHYKMHDFLKTPEKKIKRLLRKFDPHMEEESFIAIYSISPGILFVEEGFYIDDAFTKKFIKYRDIKGFSKRQGFVDDFIINTENSGFFTFSEPLRKNTGAKALEELLIELKNHALSYDELPGSKESGKVEKKKIRLTKDEKIRCNAIIHTASVAAAAPGAGLAQLPVADAFVITPIQITMVISLGAVFGIKITEGAASGIIKALASVLIGRKISQVLVGWIPVVGNAINATTAAGVTQAIGWYSVSTFKVMSKSHFEGEKSGFKKASREYEQKLRKQAAEFISNKEVWMNQREEFMELIDKYAELIVEYELKAADGVEGAADEASILRADMESLSSLSIIEE